METLEVVPVFYTFISQNEDPKVSQLVSGKTRVWTWVCPLQNLFALHYAPLPFIWRWGLREKAF